MDAAVLVQSANELLEYYRNALLVDPFYRVKTEISEGDYVSTCTTDGCAPLTWVLKLNPARHDSIEDIQYSVIEALLKVLFHVIDVADPNRVAEAKEGLVSRLATAIAGLPIVNDEQANPEDDELVT